VRAAAILRPAELGPVSVMVACPRLAIQTMREGLSGGRATPAMARGARAVVPGIRRQRQRIGPALTVLPTGRKPN